MDRRRPGARLKMLVLHDDATREYAYGPAAGPARHQGRRLHAGAVRRGEEKRMVGDQHEERLEAHLPIRVAGSNGADAQATQRNRAVAHMTVLETSLSG